MLRRTALALALAASAVGCSSTPVTTTPQGQPPAVATGAPVGAAPLDMSPVPAPKSLLLVFRSTSPKKTLAAIERLIPMPIRLEALLLDATKGASAMLDMEESFDLALALDPATDDIDDPKFFVAFGVPLSKDFKPLLDLLEKEGEEVEQLSPEHWRLRGKGADGLTCEILAPEGKRARLVCGDGTSAYRELGPWLARTLPAEPKPAQDLWLRADFAPVRNVILPKLRSEMDKGLGDLRKEMTQAGVNEPELLDAPSTFAKEVALALEEIDHLDATFAIDPNKVELSGSMELSFRGKESWLTKVMTDGAATPAQPPEAFWRLPKDSDSALFGRTADPALFLGIRRVGKKGLSVGLDFLQREANGLLKDADKQAFIGLFDSIPSFKGTWASASGTIAPLAGGFPAGGKPDSFTPQQAIVETKNRARSILGWSVISGEGDPAQMISFLSKGVDAYGRVIRIAKEEADQKLKTAPPTLKDIYRKQRAELDTIPPKVKLVQNAPGYPKGSAVLELDIGFSSEDVWTWVHPDQSWDSRKPHPKGKATRGSVPIRVVVVPEEPGRFVWGYGADPDILKAKILGSLKGAKTEGTLAARTDLGRLKRPMQGGGFLSYGRTFESLAKVDENDSDMQELLAILGKLPHKGNAPVFLYGGGKTGSSPSISAEIVFEKPWVEDLSVLVKEIAMGQKRTPAARP